jgi:hypothetical protein
VGSSILDKQLACDRGDEQARASAVYEAAIAAYEQMVRLWFKAFRDPFQGHRGFAAQPPGQRNR